MKNMKKEVIVPMSEATKPTSIQTQSRISSSKSNLKKSYDRINQQKNAAKSSSIRNIEASQDYIVTQNCNASFN